MNLYYNCLNLIWIRNNEILQELYLCEILTETWMWHEIKKMHESTYEPILVLVSNTRGWILLRLLLTLLDAFQCRKRTNPAISDCIQYNIKINERAKTKWVIKTCENIICDGYFPCRSRSPTLCPLKALYGVIPWYKYDKRATPKWVTKSCDNIYDEVCGWNSIKDVASCFVFNQFWENYQLDLWPWPLTLTFDLDLRSHLGHWM